MKSFRGVEKIDLAGGDNLSNQVADVIIRGIKNRTFSPGQNIPSITQMARYQKISPKPVQIAYGHLVDRGILGVRNGRGTWVKEDALGKLGKIPEIERGSQPDKTAARKTKFVGVVLPAVTSFQAGLLKELEKKLQQKNFHLVVGNYENRIRKLNWYIDTIASREDVQALVLAPMVSEFSKTGLARLRHFREKVYLVDNSVKGLNVPCVMVDNRAGAEKAAEHLYTRGHRKILVIAPPRLRVKTAELRLSSFVEYFKSQKAVRGVKILRGDFSSQKAYQITNKTLKSKNRDFTAVFVTNGMSCVGVLSAIHELNLKIPDDISVITFDELDYASPVPITTIAQPVEAIAGKLLHLIKRNDSSGKTFLLPPSLKQGKSVADVN